MSEYKDVGQFHKNENTGKWRFQKLGYAKPSKNGNGLDCYLDALPIPVNGVIRLSIQDQRPRDDQPSGDGMPDDSIPF